VSTTSDDRHARGRSGMPWHPDGRMMRELNRRFRRVLMLNARQREPQLSASVIARFTPPPNQALGPRSSLALAIDPIRRKLYLSDTAAGRILRYDISGTFDEPRDAEAVVGAPGRGMARECWSLSQPHGLAVDVHGALWVADTGNHRVVRYDHAAQRTTAAVPDGVVGQPNIMSIAPGCSAGHLHAPRDVAIDVDGTVWIADTENHRVLGFGHTAAHHGGARADVVLGQQSFSARRSGNSATTLQSPAGICLERDGTLWIVDRGNRRLVRHDDARGSRDGHADGAIGTAREGEAAETPEGPCSIDEFGRLWLITADGALGWWHHAALRTSDATIDGRFASSGRLTGIACGANAIWLVDAGAGTILRVPLP